MTTHPIAFEVREQPESSTFIIVALWADGRETGWTKSRTQRGARSRLTHWAKHYNMEKIDVDHAR